MIYELPFPKSPEVFENLVCDLSNFLFKTTSFSLYGRKGQSQNGIDIISNELNIIIQCKLRSVNLLNKQSKINFINDITNDIKSIINGNYNPKLIIIAATIENDILLQDIIQSIFSIEFFPIKFEFWSWSKISSELFLFSDIVNKYYPYRIGQIEIAKIAVLNSTIYKKSTSNELLFEYQNLKNLSHLPIFDFSFINNTESTITLNSIIGFSMHQPICRAGFPPIPSGILIPTEKILIDLKLTVNIGIYEKTFIDLENPIYVYPKSPFRIQLQNKKPIINFHKIYFQFNFNNIKINSPELYFNSYITISGKIY